MKNRYINDRTGKFGPDAYYQRKMHHDQICSLTDVMLHRMEKREKQKGPREIFLDEYQKKGYISAKMLIESKYGKVFNDEIFINWIGIENVRQLLFLEYKQNGTKRAHEKAKEINEKIGCQILKDEDVDRMISEEFEKAKKNEDRNEDDDAR